MTRTVAHNMGFASGGETCKLGVLCFYSSSVPVDSFVFQSPTTPSHKKLSNIILDGWYFLNLQIAPIENDATPSNPVFIECCCSKNFVKLQNGS